MSNPAIQAQAKQLNAKMESAAGTVIDTIDKTIIRKAARQSYACVLSCYDQAGTTAPSESLDRCARNCQQPHQQLTSMVQNEIGQFQNRLTRNMTECQSKAQDHLTSSPGSEQDPKMMAKAEKVLLDCMSKTVDDHIRLLKPMQDRIQAAVKGL